MELPDPQAGPANPVHDSVLTLSVRGGGGVAVSEAFGGLPRGGSRDTNAGVLRSRQTHGALLSRVLFRMGALSGGPVGPLRFRPGPGPRLLSGPGLTDGAGLVVQALRCQCDPGPLTSGSQKVWTLPSLPSPKGTPRAPGLLGEPRRVWKSPRRPFCPGPALPESAGSLCAAGPTEESPVPAWVAGLGTASQERPTPPPPPLGLGPRGGGAAAVGGDPIRRAGALYFRQKDRNAGNSPHR